MAQHTRVLLINSRVRVSGWNSTTEKMAKSIVFSASILQNLWRQLLLNVCVLAFAMLLSFLPQTARAQSVEHGKEVYAKAAQSVFLLTVKAKDGSAVSQGTGFLIEGAKIISNQHVVAADAVVIDMGPVKLSATVEKSDSRKDLALLSTTAELTSVPLKLAERELSPGETVFAIGNPQGLERSITIGIVSGVREFGGQKLLQISASISPGSSGGPILNESGEVVGVAVGMLKNGQNLNFAIPVSVLREFLSSNAFSQVHDAASLIEEANRTKAQQQGVNYSSAEDSEYQKLEEQIKQLWQEALSSAGNDIDLLDKIASEGQGLDLKISASEKILSLKPTPERRVKLAKLLNTKVIWIRDATERQTVLARTEKLVRVGIAGLKQPPAEALIILAETLEEREVYPESINAYKRAFGMNNSLNEEDQLRILQGLARVYYAQGRADEGAAWFQQLVKTGKASPWDWATQGDRLAQLKQYSQAGRAYHQAALQGGFWGYWCLASFQLWGDPAETDNVLSTGRKCLEEAPVNNYSEQDRFRAHVAISDVLLKRGVYEQALSHGREASALEAENYLGYELQAGALCGLTRFQECISAAKQALQWSDGKYSSTHFLLGSAYFDTANWALASQSYEKAAELDKTDTAAAYNVALCLGRLGYYRDAAKWYEEVLRRDPAYKDREEILQKIKALRGH